MDGRPTSIQPNAAYRSAEEEDEYIDNRQARLSRRPKPLAIVEK